MEIQAEEEDRSGFGSRKWIRSKDSTDSLLIEDRAEDRKGTVDDAERRRIRLAESRLTTTSKKEACGS